MKKVSLIGLSAVAAAVIISGCGSSSSSSSGPVAPGDIKTPAEINTTTVQNAFAYLSGTNFGPYAVSPAKAKLNTLKADIAAKIETMSTGSNNDSNTYTNTYNCTISGTRTYTYSYSSSYDQDTGGWTETHEDTYIYDNCVDNYSGNVNGEPVNRYVYNGQYGWTYSGTYNGDANMTNEKWTWLNKYNYGYENNETLTSSIYTYDNSGQEEWSADGEATWDDIFYPYAAAKPSYTDNWSQSGTSKWVETNSTGSVTGGWRSSDNYSESYSGTEDYSTYKFTQNGFYAYYDTNSSGVESLSNYNYYDHFTFETAMSGSEENVSVSGSVGVPCLGGTVTFNTVQMVHQNQDDYYDEYNSTGSNVLPYSGVATISGAGSATVTFDANDTNHTSATVVAPDGNATFGGWDTLANGSCAM